MKRINLAALTLSASALVGIAVHEAYRGDAYYATQEEKARGVSTIGFGTTKDVKQGDKTTPERALVRLLADANEFERALKRCVKVPLYQHEYDAYLSLTYNIGSGAFCRSTLVAKLNSLDYNGACKEILRWNKQSGVVLRGLVTRRQSEYEKCIGASSLG